MSLGPMLTLHVEATKATEKYAGSQKLVEVCACHLKPFSRETVCSVTKKDRVETGNGDSYMVKAVQKSDGTYARIDDSVITAAMVKELVPLAIIPRAEIPTHAVSEFWRLRPAKKVAASSDAVAFVLAWLERRDVAVVARFPYSGHQHIVALIAVGDGSLGMVRLRYAQEMREVEADHRPTDDQGQPIRVPDRAVKLIDEIVSHLPTNLSFVELEDASVSERSRLIAQVLAGRSPSAPAQAAESPVPDLMAALEAGMAGKPKSAKRKAPTSVKAKVRG